MYITVGQRTRGQGTRKRDHGPGNQDLDIKQQDQARDQRTRTGTSYPLSNSHASGWAMDDLFSVA